MCVPAIMRANYEPSTQTSNNELFPGANLDEGVDPYDHEGKLPDSFPDNPESLEKVYMSACMHVNLLFTVLLHACMHTFMESAVD